MSCKTTATEFLLLIQSLVLWFLARLRSLCYSKITSSLENISSPPYKHSHLLVTTLSDKSKVRASTLAKPNSDVTCFRICNTNTLFTILVAIELNGYPKNLNPLRIRVRLCGIVFRKLSADLKRIFKRISKLK